MIAEIGAGSCAQRARTTPAPARVAQVPPSELFDGTSGGGAAADLEGLEFESEAGKSSELRPIGNPANALAPGGGGDSVGGGGARTAIVGADSRKVLVKDSLFSGEDEAFAFRRAVSRLREMESTRYASSRARTVL